MPLPLHLGARIDGPEGPVDQSRLDKSGLECHLLDIVGKPNFDGPEAIEVSFNKSAGIWVTIYASRSKQTQPEGALCRPEWPTISLRGSSDGLRGLSVRRAVKECPLMTV